MSLKVVRRVPFVIDTTIGIQTDATQQANVLLNRDFANSLGRFKATVAIPQETPNNNSIDVITPAPAQQSGIVVDEGLRGASVFVARPMRVSTKAIQSPFRAMVPRPEHSRLNW